MKFSDKKEEFAQLVETVGLMISLGTIFLQIWVLISGIEAYFKGNYANLFPSVILSGIAFSASVISVFLTNLKFSKGMSEGRTKTYQKKSF